ncbi:MAG TPA: tripartite tricarboxylate transporter substrate binding protein [Burkholderiales bacterium]|nr:tripartite tricarboxylate transporter substrate binding protein [Burkholderiales bacterium]
MKFSSLSLCIAGVLVLGGGVAAAQDFPTKPMRFIVPFGPGSATDALARVIGQKMTEMWGPQVIVENRPGAGSVVGTAVAAKSPADGHTLLMVSASHAINATLYTKLPFDPVKDFSGVTPVALIPNILIVHPSLPAKNVKELVALAKAKPGQFNYTSAGIGSNSHLNGEVFRSTAGIKIVHVPFKGFAEAITEIISGRLEMTFAPSILAAQHIKAGKVRPLAVGTSKRSSAFPELPTMVEAGIPDCVFDGWFAVLVPAGTPRPVIEKLNDGIAKILKMPDVAKQMQNQGADAMVMTPDAFDKFIRSEVVKLGKIVKESGAKAE